MDVSLRPVGEADRDVWDRESSSAEATGPLQWFGWRPLAGVRADFARDGLITRERIELTVLADGENAGRATATLRLWGRPDTSWCWSLGFGVHRAFRGRGVGTAGQRLMVEYLFAHTRTERVEAITDVANLAEQRVLEKIGFTREGVVRRGQFRGGSWHDQILYSVLRDEVPLDLP